jgi:hypothetical protein
MALKAKHWMSTPSRFSVVLVSFWKRVLKGSHHYVASTRIEVPLQLDDIIAFDRLLDRRQEC